MNAKERQALQRRAGLMQPQVVQSKKRAIYQPINATLLGNVNHDSKSHTDAAQKLMDIVANVTAHFSENNTTIPRVNYDEETDTLLYQHFDDCYQRQLAFLGESNQNQ